jgi:hypothetical protein
MQSSFIIGILRKQPVCAGVVTARKLCLEHTKLKHIATEQKGKEQAGHDAGCGSTANRMSLDHKRASAQATQRNTKSSIDKNNRAARPSLRPSLITMPVTSRSRKQREQEELTLLRWIAFLSRRPASKQSERMTRSAAQAAAQAPK